MVSKLMFLLIGAAYVQAVSALCKDNGQYCTSNGECCKGVCTTKLCGTCKQWGTCKKAEDCCSKNCNKWGYCLMPTPKPCKPDGDYCKENGECCNRVCTTKSCGICKKWGKCRSSEDCCSRNCNTWGYCIGNPCGQEGAPCKDASDCCNQRCEKGVCYSDVKPSTTAQPSTASSEKPCLSDGESCTSKCKCCSKKCVDGVCSSAT